MWLVLMGLFTSIKLGEGKRNKRWDSVARVQEFDGLRERLKDKFWEFYDFGDGVAFHFIIERDGLCGQTLLSPQTLIFACDLRS